jgi:diaminobutyrate-2-oxoglutarate transaminase
MRALEDNTLSFQNLADATSADMAAIDSHKSAVRTYCRDTPTVFATAQGAELFDEDGKRYIDFLCAASSLNYGHNDPHIKQAVLTYLAGNGVLQMLDFATAAKAEFLRKFDSVVLKPRGLAYRVQFTGPTGGNAVEAAIKLARKLTGRRTIAAFTNGYNGVTLASLALTANQGKRKGWPACRSATRSACRMTVTSVPTQIDSANLVRQLFLDPGSGYDTPAAFIVETVQGEGGLHCASGPWLQQIATLARELDALLIVDDIQAGCGRTGPFFSFEAMDGVVADIVCLSKSISGLGLPMTLTLIRPELDAWRPGEHNGTFRGNNLAFVGRARRSTTGKTLRSNKTSRVSRNLHAADYRRLPTRNCPARQP